MADGGMARRSPWWSVLALAVAACAGWVPFVGRTLSPDEGGYLLVAAQWAPGSSLYGDLWVDRPPVLIALFGLADALGGGTALRWMGVLTVVLTVLLGGLVGRLAAPASRWGTLLPAATAAVSLATPLLGGSVVNGELLGLPFVLAGCAAALASLGATGRPAAWGWALVSGGLAAVAVLVKQNLVDVLVFGLVLVLVAGRSRSGSRPAALRLLLGATLGGLLATALVLGAAAARGTNPLDLWDAVVVFRGEGGRVIAEYGPGTNQRRLAGLGLALLGSGTVLIGLLLARAALRPIPSPPPSMPSPPAPPARPAAPDLRWPAAALLVWEVVAVLAGGSFWLHYLLGLVPGLVLLAAAAAQRPLVDRRRLGAAYVFALVSAVGVIGWVVVHPIERPEEPVIAYLDHHVRPGETAVVAFGGANILESTGLGSAYEYLWSLPVRVRDPDLRDLSAVLAGPRRPTWLIVSGASLGSWGIDSSRAEPYVASGYAVATHAGRFVVYRRTDAP